MALLESHFSYLQRFCFCGGSLRSCTNQKLFRVLQRANLTWARVVLGRGLAVVHVRALARAGAPTAVPSGSGKVSQGMGCSKGPLGEVRVRSSASVSQGLPRDGLWQGSPGGRECKGGTFQTGSAGMATARN